MNSKANAEFSSRVQAGASEAMEAELRPGRPFTSNRIEKAEDPRREAAITPEHHEAVVHELAITFNTMAPAVITQFRQLSTMLTFWHTHQGFWSSTNFGEKIALCHSELSEALEAHRKQLVSGHITDFSGVEEELADTIIRIFDLAGKMNVRLGEAVMAKLQYNLTRPHKHGKAY